MPVVERAHLSIGEVLALLQAEFPDITISKIRFLESQGLLDPERTPSGYRKFYEPDIERLRWILVQQRENFLPLRVIKDRLSGDTSGGVPVPEQQRLLTPEPAPTPIEPPAPVPSPDPAPAPVPPPAPPAPVPDPPRMATPRSLDVRPSAVSLTRDELAH